MNADPYGVPSTSNPGEVSESDLLNKFSVFATNARTAADIPTWVDNMHVRAQSTFYDFIVDYMGW